MGGSSEPEVCHQEGGAFSLLDGQSITPPGHGGGIAARQRQEDLRDRSQHGLHFQFQDSWDYIVRPCLKEGKKSSCQ